MLRGIHTTIRERGLIRPGDRVIAAVSGGADSMALLHALWYFRRTFRFRLAAVHVHHGLRGKDADRDADFVAARCAELAIPCFMERVDVWQNKVQRGGSIEMTARELRHDVFQRVLAAWPGDLIATAHHRDDQLETMVMRLFGGTGLEGVGGMAYRAEPRNGLPVIRPMLDIPKADIRAFLARYRLAWREDRTNTDTRMVRNALRHDVLPAVAKVFPSFPSALIRFGALVREEHQVLEARTKMLVRRLCARGKDRAMSRQAWVRLGSADQRRVLRLWLIRSGISARWLRYDAVERMRGAVAAGASGQVGLPDHARLVWRDGFIRVERGVGQAPAIRGIRRLKTPGVTHLPEVGLVVRVRPDRGYKKTPGCTGQYPAVVYLCRSETQTPVLEIRSRQEGDRLQPVGMKGHVSVKEHLINAKIPASEREAIPVLVANGQVVWVAGYRVARNWAVHSPSALSWRIEIFRSGKKPGR
ncbi:MAG TPA: tRNA lysidine(34) synthetase TilS [Kiritimatiellia bacterium]|nr:tRNA lysidine(34) synthetase TilS [Kiritimatiellia bacterium]HMO99382.1 tRNA lysidine(34) synthetase TilS [Kiritimatiellia bacterium]HMP96504.1 tRNA lysidine(34) synthetase TilS [Kiritimatiellia bacterium]